MAIGKRDVYRRSQAYARGYILNGEEWLLPSQDEISRHWHSGYHAALRDMRKLQSDVRKVHGAHGHTAICKAVAEFLKPRR